MAVVAVASVVIEKIIEMLKKEAVFAITFGKVIEELEDIKKEVESSGGFLIDEEEGDEAVKQWGREFLRILYELEDVVDTTHAVGIVRRRRRRNLMMSCLKILNLTNTLSLSLNNNNLTARRKMKRLATQLKSHNKKMPARVFNATTTTTTTLNLSSNGGGGLDEHPINQNCSSMKSYEADDSEEEEEVEEEKHLQPKHRDDDSDSDDGDPEILPLQSRLINQGLTKQQQISNNVPEILEIKYTDQEIELHVISEIQNESTSTSTSTTTTTTTTTTIALRPLSLATIFVRRLYHPRPLQHPKPTSFVRRLDYPKLLYCNSYDEQESAIIDHGHHVKNLVKRLTSSKSHTNGSGTGDLVISITGELGSGKTTLARAIYNSGSIKRYFDCRAWICVPKEYTKTDLLLSILEEFKKLKGLTGRAMISEQTLEDTLWGHLKDKRYLVVLDDVCKEDVWGKLKNAFPDTRNGSKIIFTTSNEDVATSANPSNCPHYLNPMSDQDGWDMLLNKAGLKETPSISSVKHKILELCKGLPLNIALVGGLLSINKLSSNNIGDEWLHQVNSWNDSWDILAICYNDLPVHSKLCLLYLALFPREFDIPVRRLLRLWLAEGFVRQFQTTTTTAVEPEDLVQKYFDGLVTRNMLQISKLRSAGSSRSCFLPGHLHDKLFPIAREISLFHVHTNSEVDLSGVRRIVEYSDIKDCPLPPSELQKLRSYLSFNIQKKDTPAREVGKFVGKIIGKNGLGLLRVLDLENVYKPSLPENLGDLVHLRYLGLRWTFLDTLPLSIGDLPYLETLDLKHTYVKSLPSSIWKLKHLQHLNLNGIRLDMPQKIMPTTSLPPLRTLWGLFVDHKSPVKNGLNRLRDLRELGITFNLSTCEDLNYLIDWVADLTDLQSLRLQSKDDGGRPSKLVLKPLSGLKHLSHMYLLGNIEKLPEVASFPPNLKVLTLSVSQLEHDPMDTLGQLPNLTVLRLLADSFLGTKFVCHSGRFSKLRVLKLWMLKELQEWEVEEDAMQSLRELNIRCCHRLSRIPETLLRLKTFEELILTNMPVEFTATIRNKKSKHTFLTIKKWDFGAPLPWEEHRTSNGV